MAERDVRTAICQVMRPGIDAAAAARADLLALLSRRDGEFPAPEPTRPTREGWSQRASSLGERLDAGYYEPRVTAARGQLADAGAVRLGSLASAYLPARYKRYYVDAAHGRPILSGRQLLQFELVNLRHVSDRSFREPALYEISAGITVFGAVGRSEGRQGSPALVTADRDGWLASNDVMRLTPRAGIRPGALWLAVAARQTRLQINALSFGSVIDHMNPWDVEDLLAPPVTDDDATAAEDAWARFSAAASEVKAAVTDLETYLGG